MKFRQLLKYFVILMLTNPFAFPFQNDLDENCTIGVASGSATSDGRPMVWKTRDYSSRPNNEVRYNDNYTYKFISVSNAGGTWAWMGVNEMGFAIVNSLSNDLPGSRNDNGESNGELMRNMLGSCATVTDFEKHLNSTDETGRDGKANFGVIDSTGAAAIFECSGYSHWRYDATDIFDAPNGYIVRTNFGMNGDSIDGSTYSIERYNRSNDIIENLYTGDSLNHKSILRYQMRDFSDENSNPVSVPYRDRWNLGVPFGYIKCNNSICRNSSVSATVIQGVLPNNEPAQLTTLWAMLGQPACAIAVPYWPVGETPNVSDGSSTSELCDVAIEIRTELFDINYDEYINSLELKDTAKVNRGLWTITFPAEDSILTAGENFLTSCRNGSVTNSEMLNKEAELANYALTKLNQGLNYLQNLSAIENLSEIPNSFLLSENYPNPFNNETTIKFLLNQNAFVNLTIYNLKGERVSNLIVNKFLNNGVHKINFNANNLPSGIYFCKINVNSNSKQIYRKTIKLSLIK